MITEEEFNPRIRKNGKKYMEKYKIIKIFKYNDFIYSKIDNYSTCLGKNYSYCPCNNNSNCKHMYALLLASKNDKIYKDDISLPLRKANLNVILNLIDKIILQHPDVISIMSKTLDKNDNLMFKLNVDKSYELIIKKICNIMDDIIDINLPINNVDDEDIFVIYKNELQHFNRILIDIIKENQKSDQNNNHNNNYNDDHNYIMVLHILTSLKRKLIPYGIDNIFDDAIKLLNRIN